MGRVRTTVVSLIAAFAVAGALTVVALGDTGWNGTKTDAVQASVAAPAVVAHVSDTGWNGAQQ